MSNPFESLVAYRLAAELGDAVHQAVTQWSSFDLWTTGTQPVRAADSIGANIAEAAGREREADRRRLFVIARGSFFESEHFLARARERGLELPPLQTAELGKVLNGLIKKPTRHTP